MIIKTRQVKGKGRGKELGFPTVNMEVPQDIGIEEGVYAGWFSVDGKTYGSAIHFGTTPTFGENDIVLEAHLLDIDDNSMPEVANKDIEIDILEKIRDVEKFEDTEDLIIKICRDVERIRNILK